MNTNCGEVSRLLKLDAYQKMHFLDIFFFVTYNR